MRLEIKENNIKSMYYLHIAIYSFQHMSKYYRISRTSFVGYKETHMTNILLIVTDVIRIQRFRKICVCKMKTILINIPVLNTFINIF